MHYVIEGVALLISPKDEHSRLLSNTWSLKGGDMWAFESLRLVLRWQYWRMWAFPGREEMRAIKCGCGGGRTSLHYCVHVERNTSESIFQTVLHIKNITVITRLLKVFTNLIVTITQATPRRTYVLHAFSGICTNQFKCIRNNVCNCVLCVLYQYYRYTIYNNSHRAYPVWEKALCLSLTDSLWLRFFTRLLLHSRSAL